MKQFLSLLAALAASLILAACSSSSAARELVGVWQCELYGSALVIEFTDDGHFIDRISGADNRYTVSGGTLTAFVPDDPESGIVLSFSVNGDTLSLGGVEYERLTEGKADKP